MIYSEILPDTIYRHKRTGGIYTVKSLGKMKSEEGQWHSCVVYFRKEDSSWFTRDLAHFIENFELVQPVQAPELPVTLSTSLLASALRRSTVALDDWLHVHAGDFCNPQDVAESAARIKEVGTVAYIADVQMQNRAALAGTTEVAEAKVVHTLNAETQKQRTDTPTADLQVAQLEKESSGDSLTAKDAAYFYNMTMHALMDVGAPHGGCKHRLLQICEELENLMGAKAAESAKSVQPAEGLQ